VDLPNKGEGQAPPPKKKIEQITTGGQETSRPATRRLFGFVFAEEPGELAKRIGRDTVVPRIKSGFEEALGSFVHGMLWGGGSNPLSQFAKGTVIRGGNVNYNAISTQQSGLQMAQAQSRPSTGPYSDIAYPTQEVAEKILANCYDLLNQYRVVAVADLKEMSGLTPGTQDNAYGWQSLDNARITKSREGYVLEMPKPSLI
jgi:hypothetical protein